MRLRAKKSDQCLLPIRTAAYQTTPPPSPRCSEPLPPPIKSLASIVYRRLRSLLSLATIGRKHKPHRQQAPQGKPGKDKNPNRGKPGRAGRGWRMGQDESSVFDESVPPSTLDTRSLDGLAKYIRDGRAKRVVFMVRQAPKHTCPQLTVPRLAPASAPPQAFPTSAARTPASTPISPV